MSSALDILTAAALNIGAVQTGEPLTAQEATDILATWNWLISSMSLGRANIFTVKQDTYNLIAGTQTYTLGTDLDSGTPGSLGPVRPIRISGINLIQNNIETPLLVTYDAADWRSVRVKSIQSLPSMVYVDNGGPYITLYFSPIPYDSSYQVVVYSWAALAGQVNLTDTVSFPDGYERLWVMRLAIEIAPMFGLTPSPTLLGLAQEADVNVKSLNTRSPRIKTNGDLAHGRCNVNSTLNYILGPFA